MHPPHATWPDPADLEIEPQAVASLQESGAPFRLIDCRELEEWDTAKIAGAELLPLGEFAERYAGILTATSEPIVVYCHHGMRSGKATHFLRQKGYQKVWSMARGIEGWSLEVDPMVARY